MVKRKIESFDNRYPNRAYTITITNPEFTSLCPRTKLPDFGTITVSYVPDKKCIELKSLKYYFLQFRNVEIFYEMAVNEILDDLVSSCKPLTMEVSGEFNTRGGMKSIIKAVYRSGRKKRLLGGTKAYL